MRSKILLLASMKYLSCYIAALFLFAGHLCAQGTSDQEEAQNKRGRLAWFVSTHIPKELDNPVMVQAGKNLVKVTLSKRSPSLPVRIPQTGIVKLVKQVPNPEVPGESMLVTLAQARVPEDVRKAMIILVPVKKQADSQQVFHTSVKDLAGFRGGDAMYINLSKLEVAVRLGDRAIQIDPGEIKIHSGRGIAKPTNMPISYHYMQAERKKWKLISASTVVVRPTRREICIFSWDTRFNRLNYHGVTFPVTR